MRSNNKKKKEAFKEDYNKIMQDYKNQDNPCFHYTQWKSPKDFIVKFSLLQEIPNSITSTDTSVIL
jgi:hypothetical protein